MSVTAADIGEAVSKMPAGLPPDVVHVVPNLSVSASYRPVVSGLRAAGIPTAGRNSWYLDADTGMYKRLTAAVRSALAGRSI
jgi:putative long chain acyl-CoA synthase